MHSPASAGEDDASKAKVIPFPAPASPKPKSGVDDDILEETVGELHQVVVASADGSAERIALDGFEDDQMPLASDEKDDEHAPTACAADSPGGASP